MNREIIATDRAPAAVGPYSQGVRVDGLVFTAGQIALDPATVQLVEGGIEAQTRQSLANLQAILEAAGSSLADVIKVTVFLIDWTEFKAMNGIYAQFFPDSPPARSGAQVGALPLGARVEIEAVAQTSRTLA